MSNSPPCFKICQAWYVTIFNAVFLTVDCCSSLVGPNRLSTCCKGRVASWMTKATIKWSRNSFFSWNCRKWIGRNKSMFYMKKEWLSRYIEYFSNYDNLKKISLDFFCQLFRLPARKDNLHLSHFKYDFCHIRFFFWQAMSTSWEDKWPPLIFLHEML